MGTIANAFQILKDIWDPDNHQLRTSNGGSPGSGGTAVADGSVFTEGSTSLTPIGGEAVTGTPAATTTGKVSIIAMTLRRAGHVSLRNNAGTEIGTSTTPVRIDPTGATIQPVSGTVAVQGLVHKGSHITVADCSTVQTPSVPSGALTVLVQCFSQNIRVTTDGTAPVTGTTGFTQSPSEGPKPYGVAGNTFKFIEDVAGASVQYQFYG